MFHRVKSENPAENPPPKPAMTTPKANPAPVAQAQPAARPQQSANPVPRDTNIAPSAPQAATPAAAPSYKTENSLPTPYIKDTQTMTDAQPKKTDMQSPDVPGTRPLDIPGGNAFQRPGQQPGWNAGNYPGYIAGGAPQASTAQSTDNKLTIGRGITMSGEIKSCNHLIVEGTVEASLTGASMLDIAQSGMFFGTVEIEEATVAGNFEGDLTVNGRLIIRSTGTIKGSITYKELEVEAGAVIDGRMTPVGAAGQDSGRSRKSAMKGGNARPSAREAQKEAANNEGELFSGNNSAAAE